MKRYDENLCIFRVQITIFSFIMLQLIAFLNANKTCTFFNTSDNVQSFSEQHNI